MCSGEAPPPQPFGLAACTYAAVTTAAVTTADNDRVV